ncbi:MAG: hypothetical protein R3277_04575 [Brumimicrobium sp.]|nr:hypothetical protein [Brumimicrobium sp.]
MKRAILFCISVIFTTCVSVQAQSGNYYFIPRGTHFSGGLYSAVPTENILFQKWRNSEEGLVQQTLLSEWYTPRMGGFFEVAYNFNEERPLMLGGSFRWQTIFSGKQKEVRTADYSLAYVPDIDWKFKKTARYLNYSIFADYSFYNYRNFHFFGRVDLGVGHYRMRNKFDWEIDAIDSMVCGPRFSENDLVLTGDLSLGIRWQFNHSSSLTFTAGYQLQTINDFRRRDYMSSLHGNLTDDNYYPKDDDFYITSNYYPGRPQRVRNEFLYFRLGLTHQITSAGFRDFMAEKPVLYLYPEDTLNVAVSLEFEDHQMIFDYPAYNQGWNVTATPNGDLFDDSGKQYYCLFWETEGKAIAQNLKEGFVIHRTEVADFLEEKLEILGLNAREKNEFIIYWLPKLQQSEYSAIYFAQEEYEAISKLMISPKPDQVIRVMMLFQGLDNPIYLEEQTLQSSPKRKGFTAVEWGGSEGEFFSTDYIKM